jgi:excisionase family DNA binding protein
MTPTPNQDSALTRALIAQLAADREALRDLVAAITGDPVCRRMMATAAGPAPSPYLTGDEAAKFLCCRKRRIYELIQDGRLPRHGDGRRVLVLRSDVEALAAGVGHGGALCGSACIQL